MYLAENEQHSRNIQFSESHKNENGYFCGSGEEMKAENCVRMRVALSSASAAAAGEIGAPAESDMNLLIVIIVTAI